MGYFSNCRQSVGAALFLSASLVMLTGCDDGLHHSSNNRSSGYSAAHGVGKGTAQASSYPKTSGPSGGGIGKGPYVPSTPPAPPKRSEPNPVGTVKWNRLAGGCVTPAGIPTTNAAPAMNCRNFNYLNLAESDLHQKDLTGSIFASADLRRTNLEDSDLRGADLGHANVDSRTRFSGAKYSDETILPFSIDEAKVRGMVYSSMDSIDKSFRDELWSQLTTSLNESRLKTAIAQNPKFPNDEQVLSALLINPLADQKHERILSVLLDAGFNFRLSVAGAKISAASVTYLSGFFQQVNDCPAFRADCQGLDFQARYSKLLDAGFERGLNPGSVINTAVVEKWGKVAIEVFPESLGAQRLLKTLLTKLQSSGFSNVLQLLAEQYVKNETQNAGPHSYALPLDIAFQAGLSGRSLSAALKDSDKAKIITTLLNHGVSTSANLLQNQVCSSSGTLVNLRASCDSESEFEQVLRLMILKGHSPEVGADGRPYKAVGCLLDYYPSKVADYLPVFLRAGIPIAGGGANENLEKALKTQNDMTVIQHFLDAGLNLNQLSEPDRLKLVLFETRMNRDNQRFVARALKLDPNVKTAKGQSYFEQLLSSGCFDGQCSDPDAVLSTLDALGVNKDLLLHDTILAVAGCGSPTCVSLLTQHGFPARQRLSWLSSDNTRSGLLQWLQSGSVRLSTVNPDCKGGQAICGWPLFKGIVQEFIKDGSGLDDTSSEGMSAVKYLRLIAINQHLFNKTIGTAAQSAGEIRPGWLEKEFLGDYYRTHQSSDVRLAPNLYCPGSNLLIVQKLSQPTSIEHDLWSLDFKVEKMMVFKNHEYVGEPLFLKRDGDSSYKVYMNETGPQISTSDFTTFTDSSGSKCQWVASTDAAVTEVFTRYRYYSVMGNIETTPSVVAQVLIDTKNAKIHYISESLTPGSDVAVLSHNYELVKLTKQSSSIAKESDVYAAKPRGDTPIFYVPKKLNLTNPPEVVNNFAASTKALSDPHSLAEYELRLAP